MAFFCKKCSRRTNSLWLDEGQLDKENPLGLCSECKWEEFERDFPAPNIHSLESCIFGGQSYKAWPHKYIPQDCPYCYSELKRVYLGSHHNHCYEEVICEICMVDFGMVD